MSKGCGQENPAPRIGKPNKAFKRYEQRPPPNGGGQDEGPPLAEFEVPSPSRQHQDQHSEICHQSLVVNPRNHRKTGANCHGCTSLLWSSLGLQGASDSAQQSAKNVQDSEGYSATDQVGLCIRILRAKLHVLSRGSLCEADNQNGTCVR